MNNKILTHILTTYLTNAEYIQSVNYTQTKEIIGGKLQLEDGRYVGKLQLEDGRYVGKLQLEDRRYFG